MWIYVTGRTFLERLPHDGDLYRAIENAFTAADIKTGVFNAIGAVKRATISFYDQRDHCYVNRYVDQPAEILCCTGNISESDGKIFVHAHITLSLSDSTVIGGHLNEGTVIFAGELAGFEMIGKQARREFDNVTGLKLWRP